MGRIPHYLREMNPGAKHKHLFYMEMAKLLGAGLDIRKSAGVLDRAPLPQSLKAILRDLNEGLDRGESIAEAFGKNPETISKLERTIISAGERGGRLAEAFEHLAGYFGLAATARQEVIKGMIYPLIILHLGVFIGSIPLSITGEDMTGGQFAGGAAGTLMVIYLGGAVVLVIGRALFKAAQTHEAVDQLLNRVPWVGKSRINMAMSRFCRVYHSCLLAGISMRETVKVSSEASQSGWIRKAGRRLEEGAREGNPLGPYFLAERAFPPEFALTYATGEEAGTLDKDMRIWAGIFQERAASATRTASVMIPKVMYFFIMAFVAWKIIGFFTSYYSGLEQIGA